MPKYIVTFVVGYGILSGIWILIDAPLYLVNNIIHELVTDFAVAKLGRAFAGIYLSVNVHISPQWVGNQSLIE